MARSYRIATFILGVAAAIGLLLWIFSATGRQQLERSISVVVAGKLGTAYSIKSQKLADREIDLGGEWQLHVDTDASAIVPRLVRAGFEEADSSDQVYYKSVVQHTFGPTLDLASYRVFRAEMALGAGTICETLPCNVAVVVGESGGMIFVSLSKI